MWRSALITKVGSGEELPSFGSFLGHSSFSGPISCGDSFFGLLAAFFLLPLQTPSSEASSSLEGKCYCYGHFHFFILIQCT
jgi:hypothetical protein